jgi:hypothetical protein
MIFYVISTLLDFMVYSVLPVSQVSQALQDYLEYFSETSRRRIDLSQIEVFQDLKNMGRFGKGLGHDLTNSGIWI